MDNVWEWGDEVGGNCWRTTGDITDSWGSMSGIGFNQAGHEKYAEPGHWNAGQRLAVFAGQARQIADDKYFGMSGHAQVGFHQHATGFVGRAQHVAQRRCRHARRPQRHRRRQDGFA